MWTFTQVLTAQDKQNKIEINYFEISKTRSFMFLRGFIQFAKVRPELFLNVKVTNFRRAYGLRRILKLFKEVILQTFSWSFFKLALTRPLQLEQIKLFSLPSYISKVILRFCRREAFPSSSPSGPRISQFRLLQLYLR